MLAHFLGDDDVDARVLDQLVSVQGYVHNVILAQLVLGDQSLLVLDALLQLLDLLI